MPKDKKETPATPARPGDHDPQATGTGAHPPAPLPDVGDETGRDAGRIPAHMVPLVAAFDAGRLRNRLRFHLEQAWFGFSNHREAARQVLGELGLAVRNLVPVAERTILQEAVVRPIEGLLERTESEAHHDYYEDWTGEYADTELTDEDFRRALEPAFEALAAVRRSIEEKLDGLAQLAFHLGDLLDRGVCPRDIHCLLGRPRPARHQVTPPPEVTTPPEAGPKVQKLKPGMRINYPEDKSRWDSIKPGEVPPDCGWYEEVRQLLIELATGLGLPAVALLPEPAEDGEPTSQLIARLVGVVGAALVSSHEESSGDGERNRTGEDQSKPAFARTSGTTEPTSSASVPPAQRADESFAAEIDTVTTGTKAAPSEGESLSSEHARDELMEARAQWAYEMSLDLKLTVRQVLRIFRDLAPTKGWPPVGTIQGIRHIARAYAERHKLDPPPSRHESRRKKPR